MHSEEWGRACNGATRRGLLTWDDQPAKSHCCNSAPTVDPAPSRIDLALNNRQPSGSVLQKLARGVRINEEMDVRLQWWRNACELARCSACAYFFAAAVVCAELLISDRNQPDNLSWPAVEFAELLPDAPGDGCYSKTTTYVWCG